MVTVSGYLNDKFNYYTPNSQTLASARSRKDAILKRLYDDHIVHMFETGSLTHGTGLWYHSDVDYFVQFFGVRPTPDTALARIKSSMQNLYPTTNIRVSRPAVKLDFTLGVKVELVPAYATGDEGEYWIPDPTDSAKWMKSAPKKHLSYVNEAQKKYDITKKSIRLLKVWKAVRSIPISSFYLEMRMAKYMADASKPLSTAEALCSVLGQLHAHGFADMQDPTAWGGKIAACSSVGSKETAKSRVRTAYTQALTATIADLNGDTDEAVAAWRKVLDY